MTYYLYGRPHQLCLTRYPLLYKAAFFSSDMNVFFLALLALMVRRWSS